MSYNPYFLVRKKDFDKNICKFKEKLEEYNYLIEDLDLIVDSALNRQKERLERNNEELNVNLTNDQIEQIAHNTPAVQRAIKKRKKGISKIKNNDLFEFLKDNNIDYLDDRDTLTIENTEYYDFSSDHNSYAFEEFLKKNKITYLTIGG